MPYLTILHRRLDRLLLLLESGSTPVIRRSAAQQLGEVQRLHPHELNNLLSKVSHVAQSASIVFELQGLMPVPKIFPNIWIERTTNT